MSCAVLISPCGTLLWFVLLTSVFVHHKVLWCRPLGCGYWAKEFHSPNSWGCSYYSIPLLSYMQSGGDSHWSSEKVSEKLWAYRTIKSYTKTSRRSPCCTKLLWVATSSPTSFFSLHKVRIFLVDFGVWLDVYGSVIVRSTLNCIGHRCGLYFPWIVQNTVSKLWKDGEWIYRQQQMWHGLLLLH